MKDLIERLEKATGPDRELDAEIIRLTGGPDIDWVGAGDGAFRHMTVYTVHSERNPLPRPVPYYTASVDSALTLKPNGLGIYLRHSLRDGERLTAEVHLTRIVSQVLGANASYSGEHDFAEGHAPTIPLALCIAALKAREQSK